MLFLATSLASALVKPITPALADEYADMLGFPSLPAIEATFTILPPPCSSIDGTAARQHRNTPIRSTPMTAPHSSGVYSHVGLAGPATPALLTSTSSPPHLDLASPTIFSTSPGFVTSTSRARVHSPPSLSRSLWSFTVAPSMSASTTHAPSAASLSLMARPMPRAAPVTSAVLPASIPLGALALNWETPHPVARRATARRAAHQGRCAARAPGVRSGLACAFRRGGLAVGQFPPDPS